MVGLIFMSTVTIARSTLLMLYHSIPLSSQFFLSITNGSLILVGIQVISVPGQLIHLG